MKVTSALAFFLLCSVVLASSPKHHKSSSPKSRSKKSKSVKSTTSQATAPSADNEAEYTSWFPTSIFSYIFGAPIYDPSEDRFGDNEIPDAPMPKKLTKKGRFKEYFEDGDFKGLAAVLKAYPKLKLDMDDIKDMIKYKSYGTPRYNFFQWCLDSGRIDPNLRDSSDKPLICVLAGGKHNVNDLVKALMLNDKFQPGAQYKDNRTAEEVLDDNKHMNKHKRIFRRLIRSEKRTRKALNEIIPEADL